MTTNSHLTAKQICDDLWDAVHSESQYPLVQRIEEYAHTKNRYHPIEHALKDGRDYLLTYKSEHGHEWYAVGYYNNEKKTWAVSYFTNGSFTILSPSHFANLPQEER